jgi:hypothetical protein
MTARCHFRTCPQTVTRGRQLGEGPPERCPQAPRSRIGLLRRAISRATTAGGRRLRSRIHCFAMESAPPGANAAQEPECIWKYMRIPGRDRCGRSRFRRAKRDGCSPCCAPQPDSSCSIAFRLGIRIGLRSMRAKQACYGRSRLHRAKRDGGDPEVGPSSILEGLAVNRRPLLRAPTPDPNHGLAVRLWTGSQKWLQGHDCQFGGSFLT